VFSGTEANAILRRQRAMRIYYGVSSSLATFGMRIPRSSRASPCPGLLFRLIIAALRPPLRETMYRM
jgi:hypothetical protein